MYIKACDLVFEKRSENGFDAIISTRDNIRKEMFACFRDVLTNRKGVGMIESGVEECVDEYQSKKGLFWDGFADNLRGKGAELY